MKRKEVVRTIDDALAILEDANVVVSKRKDPHGEAHLLKGKSKELVSNTLRLVRMLLTSDEQIEVAGRALVTGVMATTYFGEEIPDD